MCVCVTGAGIWSNADRAGVNWLVLEAKAAVHSYGIMSELLGRQGLQVSALPRIPAPNSTFVLDLPL